MSHLQIVDEHAAYDCEPLVAAAGPASGDAAPLVARNGGSKRQREPESAADATEQPASKHARNATSLHHGEVRQAGFDPHNSFCTVCKTVKPSVDFFSSYLHRNLFYCKSCCAIKAKAQNKHAKNRPSAAAARSGDPRHQAALMLQALRRLCSHPWPSVDHHESDGPSRANLDTQPLVDDVQREDSDFDIDVVASESTQHPKLQLSEIFDARTVRDILHYWRNTSALGNDSNISTDNSGKSPPLVLVPWFKLDAKPLKPWELIPVSRSQARRLADIPYRMWKLCLQRELFAETTARLEQLRSLYQSDEYNLQLNLEPEGTRKNPQEPARDRIDILPVVDQEQDDRRDPDDSRTISIDPDVNDA